MSRLSMAGLKRRVAGKSVLIDTNIIIYLLEETEPYAELSRLLFGLVEEGTSCACVSTLSVAEVMQGPIRKGDVDTAHTIKEYLLNFPNMLIHSIDESVLEALGKSPRVSWSKLRAVDNLIIATGLCNHVDLIISHDRHFKNALPEDLLMTFDT
jgi:predicted nucleic acid-binding protein